MTENRVEHLGEAEQIDILFDPEQYTAFPHVIRLDGDELLMAFRQAPVHAGGIRHTHMRSVITVMRSSDLGRTWDAVNATQLGAGGGQEFAPIYLGDGKVAGILAWHEVSPEHEGDRAGLPPHDGDEYPFRTPGDFWMWSSNYGLTWRPDRITLVGEGAMACGAPIDASDGALLVPVYGQVNGDGVISSLLYRSEDRGETWTGPVVIAGGGPSGDFCEPALMEIEPGRILAMHRIGRSREVFWWNESADGGRTWSAPEATGILSGACPRLLKLRDGRLVLSYGRRSKPHGIRAAISADGGRSWGQTEYVVRDAVNWDLGYTSSIELDDGTVFTATYMQRQGTTGIVGTFWRVP